MRGEDGDRLVPYADSETGFPYWVCGTCGFRWNLGATFKEFVGRGQVEVDEEEPLEPSWLPEDNVVPPRAMLDEVTEALPSLPTAWPVSRAGVNVRVSRKPSESQGEVSGSGLHWSPPTSIPRRGGGRGWCWAKGRCSSP